MEQMGEESQSAISLPGLQDHSSPFQLTSSNSFSFSNLKHFLPPELELAPVPGGSEDPGVSTRGEVGLGGGWEEGPG